MQPLAGGRSPAASLLPPARCPGSLPAGRSSLSAGAVLAALLGSTVGPPVSSKPLASTALPWCARPTTFWS
eukprot:4840129-Alexandrium_andersonii.AAC.1